MMSDERGIQMFMPWMGLEPGILAWTCPVPVSALNQALK